MRLCFLALLLGIAACAGAPVADGDAATADDAGKGDAAAVDLVAGGDAALPPLASAATIPLRLMHGANAAGPSDPMNAIAYLPIGLRVGAQLDVIVHLHGFINCVENVLGSADAACSASGPVRSAHHLATQLDASGRNAILLLPEVTPAARDAASASYGALTAPGALQLFLEEALDALAPALGARPALGRLVVSVHSGGYQGAAAFVEGGGVRIDELYLLDALYGDADKFETWLKADPTLLSGSVPSRRYANVYTDGGGTLAGSQAQASRLAAFAPTGALVDDRTTSTWADADYRHGLLMKHSALDHDGVVRYYAERLFATSQLAAR